MIIVLHLIISILTKLMKNVLIAGGLGLATLIGSLFVYNKRRKVEQIPREQVLAIAK